jgi:hypothetical protein
MKTEIESADQALALIQQRIAQGLTPVHHGTSFYRYNFSKSQFGSYVFYLDERGTVGRCQYQNVERVFDFVDMGLPVPGYLFEVRVPRTAPVAIAVVVSRQRAVPSLLDASVAALKAMDAAGIVGPARDDLALAIKPVRDFKEDTP